MTGNFHETYLQEEIKPPSERATGLVFATVAAIVALVWWDDLTISRTAAVAAAVLLAASLLGPSLLKPLNRVWFHIGLLLHRVVNPLVMFLMFAAVFVPAGWLMRIWYDPLRAKRGNKWTSYWIDRDKTGAEVGSMRNQF
jgi:hypothetical protein